VADAGNRRVTRWTAEGRPAGVLVVDARGAPMFGSPRGIHVDGRGYVYVADAQLRQVLVFTPGLQLAARLTAEGGPGGPLQAPQDAATHGGFCFIADGGGDALRVLDRDGAAVQSLAGLRPGDGFRSPASVAAAPDGSLYLADTGKHRVLRIQRREAGSGL
jgi:sugar lactone lactonase YvrE